MVLLPLGFALSVLFLRVEFWNRSEARRRTGVNKPLWPWIAGSAIMIGGAFGLASSLDSGDPSKFVATGVFVVITLTLFAWGIRGEMRR